LTGGGLRPTFEIYLVEEAIMTTLRTPVPAPVRTDAVSAALERLGLALLVWAAHRRAATPRTIDLGRVERGPALGRPFC
jgi:hypothetical protein